MTLASQGRRRLGLWLGLSVLIVGLTGCGYTVVGSGAAAQHRVLAVLPFTNQTREPGVENHVTIALRQAMLHSPVFTLVAADTSVLRIQGIVRQFRISAVAYDQSDNALQYRLEADILIRVTDGSAQLPMLERVITAWAEYLVFRGSEIGQGAIREHVVAREAALAQLAQRFADDCTALLMVALL